MVKQPLVQTSIPKMHMICKEAMWPQNLSDSNPTKNANINTTLQVTGLLPGTFFSVKHCTCTINGSPADLLVAQSLVSFPQLIAYITSSNHRRGRLCSFEDGCLHSFPQSLQNPTYACSNAPRCFVSTSSVTKWDPIASNWPSVSKLFSVLCKSRQKEHDIKIYVNNYWVMNDSIRWHCN
jgi:hypothetical protein